MTERTELKVYPLICTGEGRLLHIKMLARDLHPEGRFAEQAATCEGQMSMVTHDIANVLDLVPPQAWAGMARS